MILFRLGWYCTIIPVIWKGELRSPRGLTAMAGSDEYLHYVPILQMNSVGKDGIRAYLQDVLNGLQSLFQIIRFLMATGELQRFMDSPSIVARREGAATTLGFTGSDSGHPGGFAVTLICD